MSTSDLTLMKQSAVVRFDNGRYINEGSHYLVKIVVRTLKDPGQDREYYDIQYAYEFVNKETSPLQAEDFRQTMHPFYNGRGLGNVYSNHGDVIHKNAMTTEMVRHLLMDDRALSKAAGPVLPQKYRISIMSALSAFWY